jgi:hypothetical protein
MNANREKRLDQLTKHLKVGRLYRACELEKYSTSIARDLRLLVDQKYLKSAGRGLYYRADKLGDTELPVRSREVVKKFLNTDHFIMRSISDFNRLDLGLTQMFNQTFVYNAKRFGEMVLDGRTYFFVRRDFPKDKATWDEYLFVDFFNNIDATGENKEKLFATFDRKWKAKAWDVDYDLVYKYSQRYGKNWVKKYFQRLKDSHDVFA